MWTLGRRNLQGFSGRVGGWGIRRVFSATYGQIRATSSPSAEEAVDEDEQNCAADEDVELVALESEAGDAEDDAENGSCDEEEDSELDDALGV